MNQLRKSLFLAIPCIISIMSVSAFAADDFGKGAINWTEGYIDAVGYGTAHPSGNKGKDRINARRSAEVTAQRALLETIKGVRITSTTTVEDSMLKEDKIKTRVDGVIKGAQTIDEKIEWEGNAPVVTVKMRICINGGLTECKGNSLVNALDLENREQAPFIPQRNLAALAPLPEKPAAKTEIISTPATPRPFLCDLTKSVTGVVFTLEGRYFERSLLPVVVTQSGGEGFVTVYSAKVVKPSVIRTYGAIRYADSVDNAVKQTHVCGNVLVVPVKEITKENMMVINASDASTIKETLAHGNNYLEDAKVIISAQ